MKALNASKNISKGVKKYPYKLAQLRTYGGSLHKIWHVEYYIYDIVQHVLIRRRVTVSNPTVRQREAEAATIIKDINTALKNGAVYEKYTQTDAQLITTDLHKITLLKACTYYLEYQANILKKRSIESYRTDLKRLSTFITTTNPKQKIADFKHTHAQLFLDQIITSKNISNRTINNQRGSLKAFFNFFVKRKIITENPFSDFKSLPQVSTQHAAFSKEQAAAVKAEIIKQGDSQLLLFISAIYYCSIRPRYELRLLKVSDILEKTILIRSENAKNSTSQHIIIPDQFKKIINEQKIRSYNPDYYVFGYQDQPGPEPLGRNNLYNRHRAILDTLGLHNKYLDTYSWKHTGVIALFQATQNIELVRQHCRHADIATTQKYLRDLGQFIDYTEINKFPEF